MELPKGWDDLTIKMYLGIHKIIQEKDIDLIDRQVMILASLLNKTTKEIEDIPIDSFREMVISTKFLYEDNLPTKIPISIIINGIDYLFDPIKPIKKAGEFIDLTHLTKDPDGITYNIHKILAVLCKPKEEQAYEERVDIFYNHMPISVAYPIALFFWTVFQRLLPLIQNSLEKEIEKNLKVMEEMVS